ncbi:MAG TPA: hypothetical protein VLU25_22055 [Acidobacteriota bacterium]|nr:hypothetical protein [Acidobacteriota bacterium]
MMDFRGDFSERLQSSRYQQERERIERICRNFTDQVEQVFEIHVRRIYGRIEGVTVESARQRYTCRLGEFRPAIDFYAQYLRVAADGKQICIALTRPAEEEPSVHYIVGKSETKPVDADDSIYIRGRSLKEVPVSQFSADTFNPQEFHDLLVKELIEEL